MNILKCGEFQKKKKNLEEKKCKKLTSYHSSTKNRLSIKN